MNGFDNGDALDVNEEVNDPVTEESADYSEEPQFTEGAAVEGGEYTEEAYEQPEVYSADTGEDAAFNTMIAAGIGEVGVDVFSEKLLFEQ